jgi:hypothetical protein
VPFNKGYNFSAFFKGEKFFLRQSKSYVKKRLLLKGSLFCILKKGKDSFEQPAS